MGEGSPLEPQPNLTTPEWSGLIDKKSNLTIMNTNLKVKIL